MTLEKIKNYWLLFICCLTACVISFAWVITYSYLQPETFWQRLFIVPACLVEGFVIVALGGLGAETTVDWYKDAKKKEKHAATQKADQKLN